MKKILYLVFAALLMAACSTEPRFVIKANIEGSDSVTFILQKRGATQMDTLSTAVSKKGMFTMKGSVEYPEQVQLVALNTTHRLAFWIENANISITGKLDSLLNATVTGSKTQDEYKSYMDGIKPLSEKYQTLVSGYREAQSANDTARMRKIREDAAAIENDQTNFLKEFIKNNPASYVTPTLLRSISYELSAEEIESAIAALDTSVAKVQIVKDLKTRAEAMKAVSAGKKAPDFTQNDVEGNPVSLYSKVGAKLLLVDFWAAWCGPCRAENPNVVKVYKEFNKKGFDVFGVSLDRTKEDWVKAIKDDNLTWTHVSDLQYWNSAAAKLYAVNSIPANFLLDENGVIIARNLRGDDLYNKVKEVLGK